MRHGRGPRSLKGTHALTSLGQASAAQRQPEEPRFWEGSVWGARNPENRAGAGLAGEPVIGARAWARGSALERKRSWPSTRKQPTRRSH
jgi:hypothetical protein